MRTVPDPATEQLAREMTLVESAIAVVATGRARRVHLGGLAFGDALVEHARAVAARCGVRVVPAWRTDEAGLDLEFERDVDAPPPGQGGSHG